MLILDISSCDRGSLSRSRLGFVLSISQNVNDSFYRFVLFKSCLSLVNRWLSFKDAETPLLCDNLIELNLRTPPEMATMIPKNSVWAAMSYVPPRGRCNYKTSLMSPACPCLRFMLHPVKVRNVQPRSLDSY